MAMQNSLIISRGTYFLITIFFMGCFSPPAPVEDNTNLPDVINFNSSDTLQDTRLDKLEENLMLHVDFFGCLFSDHAVTKTFYERKPLRESSPSSFVLEDINMLSDRIIRLWTQPIGNSSDLLIANANKVFKKRQS